MCPAMRPGALLPLLLAAAAATAQPRVCRVAAGEDCAALWADFRPAATGATSPAVVILTFEGDGYYAGAQATIASAISKAHGPLLFGVASSSHAAAIAEWFISLRSAAAPGHALCSVDPRSLPDVWARAQELSGALQFPLKPDHQANGGAAAPSALYRVFLRQLFPHAVRALYVDADVIVQADAAAVVAEVGKPMALPLVAARAANLLKSRMDYCCQASKKVRKLLANASDLDAGEAELLQEYQDLAASYREFNNGVMALDLVKLEEAGVFQRLQQWLQLNLKHGLFNGDQHAWNLAATLHWQDLQESFPTNAPSLERMEASVREKNPVEDLKTYLRSLAFVHYVNQPKPWQVDWAKVPKGALFDDSIWLEAFLRSDGADPAGEKFTLSERKFGSQELIFLRPGSNSVEDFEYGMLYMEGSGGLGADPSEARWRLTRAAEAGDAQAKFMISRGLEEQLKMPDKMQLKKLERCYALAGQRIDGNEDHQTLMGLYKMGALEYLAKKAPDMIPSCYWRLQPKDLEKTAAHRKLSPAELEALFGSSDEASSPPGLTPRLSTWLQMVTKDNLETAVTTEAAKQEPPVALHGWFILPALGLVAAVVGGLVWNIFGAQDQRDRKNKKKKHK